MSALTQTYRTACVSKTDEPQYNEETLAAMQETLDIVSGKVKAKRYKTAAEMHDDILAEAQD